ncbi:MAG TPA: AI-2E family transporter [Candidatus Binatia bacterium]|nr:AI-2E family transporter [Candidatus Binatia bacterium]
MVRVERNPPNLRSPAAGPAELHLWQIAAARDITIILGAAFTVWVVYRLGDIFLPVLLALILAHIINPFVTLMERRWGWARPLTISLILTAITLSLIGLFAWLGPILYEQSTMLANRLPDYLRTLTAAYGVESGTVIDQLDETIRRFQIDPKQVVGQLFRTTGRAVGILTFVFSATTYWLLSIALVAIYVFFFSWHFNSGVEKLRTYVPASRRPRVRAIVARMDGAIGDFFRGRLLIAIIMGVLLSAGWFFADVPYWFFLGMLTGLLNIVPYLSVISWPIAILLKYLDTLTNASGASPGLLAVVLWPSVVYVAVQFLEGWFLTPWIQSGQTNMSAVTIILVVIIGGVVAGVLGMLLAIPVAACIKIFFEEVVLPPLARWAATH